MVATRIKLLLLFPLFLITAIELTQCCKDSDYDNPLDPLVMPVPANWRTYQDLDEEKSPWVNKCIPPDKTCDGMIEVVSQPSRDGSALKFSLKPDVPFVNAQFFRNFPLESNATEFILSLFFKYEPDRSKIQAIEFSVSKWQEGKRWEWATQWENIAETGAFTTPPIMRIWDGMKWIDKGIDKGDTLSLDTTWHHLTLRGDIKNRKLVRYINFEIDGILRPLGDEFDPRTQPDSSKIAIHVQLDGTGPKDPYDVYVDKVYLMFKY
jgi:hypothetical protein